VAGLPTRTRRKRFRRAALGHVEIRPHGIREPFLVACRRYRRPGFEWSLSPYPRRPDGPPRRSANHPTSPFPDRAGKVGFGA
jgi:hypothetical protein